MPEISFVQNKFKPINVSSGAVLMKSLLEAGVPVASSCKGDGVCAKCKIRIIAGKEHLSKPNEAELFLLEKNNIPKDYRISCQAQIYGDITVDASYW